MKLSIEHMNKENSLEIFEFEVENREFFELTLRPRPNGYFEIDKYNIIVDELLEECKSGDCYLHLIRDNETQKVVGRINLQITNTDGPLEAELGYRVSEAMQGKGVASEAVRLIKKISFEDYGIKILRAGTSALNIGSQRVLEKNGFLKIGVKKNALEIDGKLVDDLLYEFKNIK